MFYKIELKIKLARSRYSELNFNSKFEVVAHNTCKKCLNLQNFGDYPKYTTKQSCRDKRKGIAKK